MTIYVNVLQGLKNDGKDSKAPIEKQRCRTKAERAQKKTDKLSMGKRSRADGIKRKRERERKTDMKEPQ